MWCNFVAGITPTVQVLDHDDMDDVMSVHDYGVPACVVPTEYDGREYLYGDPDSDRMIAGMSATIPTAAE